MGEVWLNYTRVLGFIGSNLVLAGIACWILRSKLEIDLSERAHALITLAGTVLLLLAGLGKLGWSIQTWDGNTPPEQLNDTLFKVFSYAGMFLVFLEWFWTFSKKSP